MKSYRTRAVLDALAGFGTTDGNVSMNQLLHWVEKGILKPSIKEAEGHPSYREYALRDILRAGIIARFLRLGMSLKAVEKRLADLTSVKCLSSDNPCSLWEVYGKKADRERYRYYYEFGFHERGSHSSKGIEKGIVWDWGFCGGLHEIIGLLTRTDSPLHLSGLKMVDLLEVLETLEKRNGDYL